MSTTTEFYATHSAVSDPGGYAHLFNNLVHDLPGISRIAQGLIYHYVADQYTYGYCPPKERIGEADTRYLERILARLIAMDSRPLSEPRAFENRLVGCCRDFSLIACAILRHQNIPARLRHGFASYFIHGYWLDHVIVEVWTGSRWQRFDPELSSTREWGFNVLSVLDTQFITGGVAWQKYRSNNADPSRFGLGPDVPEVSGIPFIVERLLLDVAALNKQEMLCWDQWGLGKSEHLLSTDEENLLDQVALLSDQTDVTALRELYARDARLHVSEIVTSFSPALGPHQAKVF